MCVIFFYFLFLLVLLFPFIKNLSNVGLDVIV